MSQAIIRDNGYVDNVKSSIRRIAVHRPQTARMLYRHWERFLSLKDDPQLGWEYSNYEEIVTQYIELYSNALEFYCFEYEQVLRPTLRDDEFFDRLEHTISATQNTGMCMTGDAYYKPTDDQYYSRLHVGFSRMFNYIAGYWDKQAKKELQNDPCHRFILSVSNRTDVQAYSYFSVLPPDKRLCDISLPIGVHLMPSRMFPLVLHEMGHYIAPRNRNKRRDIYHQLVISELCLRLYHAGAAYLMSSDKVTINAYAKEDSSEQERRLSAHLLGILDGLVEEFKAIFDRYYDVNKEQMVKCYKDGDFNEIEKRYAESVLFTVEGEYSSALIRLTTIALNHCLEEMQQTALNSVRKYVKQFDTYMSIRSLERLQNDLEYILYFAFRMEKLKWATEEMTASIPQMCMTYLTELAADLFMVRTLKMRKYEYLWLFFESWLNQATIEGLAEVLRSRTVIMRYANVYSCIDEEDDPNDKLTFIEKQLQDPFLYDMYDKNVLRHHSESTTSGPLRLSDDQKKSLKDSFEYFEKSIKKLIGFREDASCGYQSAIGGKLHIRQLELVWDYADAMWKSEEYRNFDKVQKSSGNADKYVVALRKARSIYRNCTDDSLSVAEDLISVLDYSADTNEGDKA